MLKELRVVTEPDGGTGHCGMGERDTEDQGLNRRTLLKASLACGGIAGLAACADRVALPLPPPRFGKKLLMPYRASPDRIIDIKCCIRPFRPQGPRLDAERVGDKLVVHNYGHSGSGWSLSWGSADVAVEKARTALPRRMAVIGCGIIGLTSAITAQRAGLDVTIYARDLFPRTRSVRASGWWTPSSRIALTAAAAPDFADLWERMARFSWKTYGSYLGLADRPVDFCDSYFLSDLAPGESRPRRYQERDGDYASTGMPQHQSEFADYTARINDVEPRSHRLTASDNPFPVQSGVQSSTMFFNFSSMGHVLLSEFREAGGRIEIREFHDPSELASLPEPVIINCPGYAARDLWRDSSLIPIRGQTGWLVPQPEVTYALRYRGVMVLPKSDGVMIHNVDPNDMGDLYGLGDSNELPDRADTEDAVRIIAELFSRLPA